MFKTPKVGPAKRSPQKGVPRELRISLDSDLSGLRIRGPSQGSSSSEVQDEWLPHIPKNAQNWSCSVIGLLCICVIFFLLVTLMNLKVAMLKKRTKEEAALWQWKILTLTEIFRDLQMGKVLNCSICKIQWMQLSEKCYFFRNRKMNWESSQRFCQEEDAELMVVSNKDEMQFLKFHASMHYYLDPKTYKYDKFWIGLVYDIAERKWLWLDGTAYKPSRYGILGDHGCAYIQNDTLHSQPCGKVAKSICETTVQFGWSM
ncbi:C-type lectin domain family 2 member F-like isoform X1 [Pantherophis guttatus]|uniref:C-type lectin domain family 2 member F-like isoform X1 n=1 Tax=Pantherophis guttatus TaxID=94885 RepID=A0ABM3ZA87_PANGU|nr:C-type lectin domain family 2 member F-like isoform X1 [Pantherophis guttatus]